MGHWLSVSRRRLNMWQHKMDENPDPGGRGCKGMFMNIYSENDNARYIWSGTDLFAHFSWKRKGLKVKRMNISSRSLARSLKNNTQYDEKAPMGNFFSPWSELSHWMMKSILPYQKQPPPHIPFQNIFTKNQTCVVQKVDTGGETGCSWEEGWIWDGEEGSGGELRKVKREEKIKVKSLKGRELGECENQTCVFRGLDFFIFFVVWKFLYAGNGWFGQQGDGIQTFQVDFAM